MIWRGHQNTTQTMLRGRLPRFLFFPNQRRGWLPGLFGGYQPLLGAPTPYSIWRCRTQQSCVLKFHGFNRCNLSHCPLNLSSREDRKTLTVATNYSVLVQSLACRYVPSWAYELDIVGPSGRSWPFSRFIEEDPIQTGILQSNSAVKFCGLLCYLCFAALEWDSPPTIPVHHFVHPQH